jgi:glutamyl-tRNA reductase
MRLITVGINHRTAPVEIREKLSFRLQELIKANRLLKERAYLEEDLILSTCNRVEIYAVANSQDRDYLGQIKCFLSEFHSIDRLDFEDRLYIYKDEEVIRHLFKVASGLDSMIIGEMEILSQVKNAYKYAVDSCTTGKILNKLLQKAFNTAKKIRTDTSLTRRPVSVSSVASRLAKKILGDLTDKRVLVVGTGKIGEQLILYLKKNGIKSIFVANRTFEKAHILANNYGAIAIKFDNFRDSLTEIDIVITSTAAPHCIISKADILSLMPKRKQKPLFIIDLAVPRDVEAQVNRIDNVYLYDIDDLQKIADRNMALRKNELAKCQKIISASCENFIAWWTAERTNKR